jgi:UDP:flavonoid glycosyltransferase YjiC (YdhE family)
VKVAFVVGHALGHVGRALNVASALRASRQSCDITFVGNNPGGHFEKYVSPQGFAAVPISSTTEPSPESYARLLADAISRVDPDVLVYDLSPFPWLLLAGAFPVPQAYLTNYFVTRLGGDSTAQDVTFAANKSQINAARQRFGLPLLASVRELYEKDRVILADPPQLLTEAIALPQNYTLAGAIWWTPEDELPPDLQELRDILYVSLGSTGSHISRRTLASIATSLHARHVVVTSTKRAPDADAFASIPISYYDSLPGGKVLDRSILAITQGGAGSCYQALSAGVPLGISPLNRNHYLLGKRLAQLGLAFMLDMDTMETVLEEFLRDRAAITERLSQFRGMNSTVASQAAAAAIGALF